MIQWSVATAFFILVMAVAGYVVYNEALAGGRHVEVPDIVDVPITEATLLLAERGLELGDQTPVSHPTVPAYHVISQRPESGRVVRSGRKVYPTVSLGADVKSAPEVVQMYLEDAQKTISGERFRVGSVARVPSERPRDWVLAQDPEPGRNMQTQGEINLLVSAGQEERSSFMPDLRGMTIEDALQEAAPLGLTMISREVDLPDARPGIVLDQDPPPDTRIYEGQKITYYVKTGEVEPEEEPEPQSYFADFRHEMPYDFYDREVRVDVVDETGGRSTLFTKPAAFDAQSRASQVAGSELRIQLSYSKEAMVEIYVDGRNVVSYYLRDGQNPRRAGG